MSFIKPTEDLATLVNVFTVADRAAQDALISSLSRVTETVMRDLPGFVSANVHRGLDGRHVINYAQWESLQHFQAMLRDERIAIHLKQVEALATSIAPILCNVVYVCERE